MTISDNSPSDGTVRAASRVLRVLSVISPEGTTLSEVASATSLSLGTTSRLLKTLMQDDYVARGNDGKYIPGTAAYRLAMSIDLRSTVRLTVRQGVMRLGEELNETVAFYVREGTERVCTDSVESQRLVRRVCAVGDRGPVHLGAAGKVLMAFGDVKAILASIPGIEEGVTTIAGHWRSLANLRRELLDIRRDGVAFSKHESTSECWGISAPVFVRTVLLGALSVVVTGSRRNDEYAQDVSVACRLATKEISAELSDTRLSQF